MYVGEIVAWVVLVTLLVLVILVILWAKGKLTKRTIKNFFRKENWTKARNKTSKLFFDLKMLLKSKEKKMEINVEKKTEEQVEKRYMYEALQIDKEELEKFKIESKEEISKVEKEKIEKQEREKAAIALELKNKKKEDKILYKETKKSSKANSSKSKSSKPKSSRPNSSKKKKKKKK